MLGEVTRRYNKGHSDPIYPKLMDQNSDLDIVEGVIIIGVII